MNRMPIVRFSSKEYINQLQAGHLFLRNNMYYQYLEATDAARSDIYDGSLPFPDNGLLEFLAGETINNARIMRLDAYVSCYYHCHCIRSGCFYIPESDKEELRKFNSDTAIVIDIDKFEERLQIVCAQKGIEILFGDVTYYNDEELAYLVRNLKGGNIPQILSAPQLLKDRAFFNQHEYRVSVTYKPKMLLENPSASMIRQNDREKEELRNSIYLLDIGSIEDFSTVIPTEELFTSYIMPIQGGDSNGNK